MVVTQIEENKKNKYLKSVYVDHEFAFDIPLSYYRSFRYKVYDEITVERIDYYNNEVMLPKIKKKALTYLLKRPYGKMELFDKLISYGFDEGNCTKVIEYLEELGYLSDRDFARIYIYDALTIKKHSVKRIKYDLRKKGICEEYINEFIDENKDEAMNTLCKEITKKLSRVDASNRDELNKVKMYLFRKGYSPQEVKQAFYLLTEGDR